MNTRKLTVTVLLLAVGLIGTIVIAQQERTPKNEPQLDAAELERLATQPSLEQEILKLAAEKLRQERKVMTAVEMPLTVRVRKLNAPPCWYEICVNEGTKKVACKTHICITANPL